jgi:hypothetical protein
MNADGLHICVYGAVIGGGFLIGAVRRHKQLRQIEDQPSVKTESAAQGLAEFQGFGWAKDFCPLHFDGKELLYYKLALQEEVTEGSGKNRRKVWRTRATHSHTNAFYLVDATGLAELNQGSSEIVVNSERTCHWGRLSQKEKDYLLANFLNVSVPGFPPTGGVFGLFSRKFRIQESRINLGSPIYAKGHFESPAGGRAVQVLLPGLAKFFSQVFDLQSRGIRNEQSLLDKNGDGKVSVNEALEGYTNLAQFSRKQAKLGNSPVADRELPVHGVLSSSTEHKLIIADCFEGHLRTKFRRQFYAFLAPGLAILLGAFFLAQQIEDGKIVVKDGKWSLASSVTTTASNIEGPVQFHEKCLGGNLSACRTLMSNSVTWKLEPASVVYYRRKACELGDAISCSQK